MKPIYVTGNSNKAHLFNKMVGIEFSHERVDLDEIQSLDLHYIIEHKAKEAYRILQKPLLVEDTILSFVALGRLPGPLIKWFIEEIGLDSVCRMLDSYNSRDAVAGAAIAFYDGDRLKIFENKQLGVIADHPRGSGGFGWDRIFIPEGQEKTRAEMNVTEYETFYKSSKPFSEVREFLISRVDS